jgi:hypothetical protein
MFTMDLENMNSRRLIELTKTKEPTLIFCEYENLMPVEKLCPVCSGQMKKNNNNKTKLRLYGGASKKSYSK